VLLVGELLRCGDLRQKALEQENMFWFIIFVLGQLASPKFQHNFFNDGRNYFSKNYQ
jgi:hypothetical protein